ncbi:hypothetical protein [Blattabacterium cuenoti]
MSGISHKVMLDRIKYYEKMKTPIQKNPCLHQLSIMGEYYKNGRIRS